MNIINIINKFSTQESCIEYLEKKKWNNEPVCPYCSSKNNYPVKSELRHKCRDCGKSFSVMVNTIFHHTHLPITKWFLAITLMLNTRKGLSSLQLSRDLDIPYKTAWSLSHRIRKAMKGNQAELLSGIVEMDETYIGGKPRKEAKKKDKDDNDKGNPRGRGTKKQCVVGMIERGGNVKAGKVNKDELKAKDLQELVRRNINTSDSILTWHS